MGDSNTFCLHPKERDYRHKVNRLRSLDHPGAKPHPDESNIVSRILDATPHNFFLPVWRAPNEILGLIFQQTVHDAISKWEETSSKGHSYLRKRREREVHWTLAHVCQRWREVAKSSPRLWRFLLIDCSRVISHNDNLRLQLTFSAATTLQIDIINITDDAAPLYQIWEAISMPGAGRRRCSSMNIRTTPRIGVAIDAPPNTLPSSFPRPESITVQPEHTAFPAIIPTDLAGLLQHAKAITLIGLCMPLQIITQKPLVAKAVHLQFHPYYPTTQPTLPFLSNAPFLRRCSIHASGSDVPFVFPMSFKHTFLSHFSFQWGQIMNILPSAAFSVSLPNLRSISIHHLGPRVNSARIVRLQEFLSMTGTIQKLQIRNYADAGKSVEKVNLEVAELLQLFGNVATLLVCRNATLPFLRAVEDSDGTYEMGQNVGLLLPQLETVVGEVPVASSFDYLLPLCRSLVDRRQRWHLTEGRPLCAKLQPIGVMRV